VGIRVLIADDQAMIRTEFRLILEAEEGVRPSRAASSTCRANGSTSSSPNATHTSASWWVNTATLSSTKNTTKTSP
jgi:hypothetical protein